MGLTLKSWSQFVSDLQAGVVAITSKITDWSAGEPALAMAQSFATQFTFLQTQAQQVWAYARLGTVQTDADADSFVADYVPAGFTPRLPATFDVGPAHFTRNQASTSNQVLLVGSVIQNQTPAPAQAIGYAVIADTTNAAYSATAGGPGVPGYTLTAGLLTFAQDPLVQAAVAGTGSNMIAGALSVIASGAVPFDNVTNPAAIANAQNQESTIALKARWAKWVSGIAGGTNARMGAAILGVQSGITYTINDGLNAAGAAQVPFFTVVADDGSGAIPAGTLTAIAKAVDTYRTPGMPRAVIAPTNELMTIAVNGTSWNSGTDPATGRAALQAAILAFVAANGVGGASAANAYVPSGKLSYVALVNLAASFIGIAGVNGAQGLAGYASVTLNGGTADVALSPYQLAVANAGSVAIS